MNPTITAHFPECRVHLRSPLLTGILSCIDGAYDGAGSVVIGDSRQSGDPNGLGSFLSFVLAYPPGVQTPVVTSHGLLAPQSDDTPAALRGRTVVLASGGIDSTAAILHLQDTGCNPVALWCDYGQSYAEPEQMAVREVCSALRVELIEVAIDLGDRVAQDRMFGHVIPARNLLIAACAASLHPSGIVLAGLADELVVPDKSLRMYAEAVRHLGVPVTSPFVAMTKTDILRVWSQGWDERLSATRTVSCYRADGDCQDCPACAKRAVAMVASGYLVTPFSVFANQEELIIGSWLPRLPDLPVVRRADLLIALDLLRDQLPSSFNRAQDAAAAYAPEVVARRRELADRRDVR